MGKMWADKVKEKMERNKTGIRLAWIGSLCSIEVGFTVRFRRERICGIPLKND
jgi:hypothetical protein